MDPIPLQTSLPRPFTLLYLCSTNNPETLSWGFVPSCPTTCRREDALVSNCFYTSNCVVHAQPCPTLCNPMGCSPPGSSVHGISQAGILVWVAISFSRGSSRLRCVLNGQVDSFPLSRQGSSHLHCRISFTETLQLGLTLGMTLPSCLPQKTVPFIFK